MQVQAYHLGQRIDIRRFQAKEKQSSILTKDANMYFYSPQEDQYFIIFRYGVVVFWGLGEEQTQKTLRDISPFVQSPIQSSASQETIQAFIKKRGKTLVEDGEIYVTELDPNIVKLVSVVLARSVILDYFERQVDEMLYHFGEVIDDFSRGQPRRLGSRELLRQVALAMKIQNVSVTQMAMLDKPDFTWEDSELDKLYDGLDTEYEIADRYDILKQKLETLFHDSKFILDYLESRRNFFLEFTIISLILVEVVLFVYELGWM